MYMYSYTKEVFKNEAHVYGVVWLLNHEDF